MEKGYGVQRAHELNLVNENNSLTGNDLGMRFEGRLSGAPRKCFHTPKTETQDGEFFALLWAHSCLHKILGIPAVFRDEAE
jgi:hypothetical protein